tara:strand:+ start:152 stop:601 length:450 start_codon:yes stop_codon:yes gene_type:complete
MINDVELNYLKPHFDDRGFFNEIGRLNNSFFKEGIKQISHSLVKKDVLKAWHAHTEQFQWNYVVNGLIYVALYDNRKKSSTYGEKLTFLTGENHKPLIYKFPPGVLHGYKCINGPMNIVYLTSGTYDLNDEVRISQNDKNISFDWSKIQ